MTRVSKGLKGTYPVENMIEAVEAVRAGASIREAASKYGVPRSTLGDRVSGRIDLNARPGRDPVFPKEVEDSMVGKAMSRADQGFGLSKRTMIARAGTLCKTMGLKNSFTNGKPGKAWWAGLKARHPELTLRRPEKLSTTRSKAMNPTVVGAYFQDLQGQVSSLNPSSIWNMDETSMCLEHQPVNVVARKGSKTIPGRTANSRETVTFLPCINAAGQKMPPLIIVKGKTTRSLRSYNVHEGPTDALWTYQKNAYMTDEIGDQWFTELFLKHCGDARPQILIMDNHHSHESLSLLEAASANGITVLTFPPHTTHYLCPLDRAVFGPFQREYDSVCSDYTSSSVNAIVNKVSFPKLLNQAFVKSFTRVNIVAGFQSTGIYDWNPLIIPVKAFSASDAFDKLNQSCSTPEDHPLKWAVHAIESPDPDDEESVVTEMEVEDLPSSAQECLEGTLSTPMTLRDNNIPLMEFCPDIIDSEGNIVGRLHVDGTEGLSLSSDNDPVMPNVMSDQEAANVLVALNDSSSEAATLSVKETSWPESCWNRELDALFSIGSPETTKPAKEMKVKRVTSHRLLTSKEVLDEKRQDQLKKELKAKKVEERKKKSEEISKIKAEKQKIKNKSVNKSVKMNEPKLN